MNVLNYLNALNQATKEFKPFQTFKPFKPSDDFACRLLKKTSEARRTKTDERRGTLFVR